MGLEDVKNPSGDQHIFEDWTLIGSGRSPLSHGSFDGSKGESDDELL